MSPSSSAQKSAARGYSAWEQKAAWLFLLVVVAIVAAGMRAFEHYSGDLRASVERDLLAISALKRAQIEDLFDGIESDALILVRRPAVQAVLESGTPEHREAARALFSSLTQSASGTRGYHRIMLFDRAMTDTIGDARRVDDIVLSSVRDAVATGRPSLVGLFVGADGVVHFGRAQPIRSERGATIVGALYLEMDARRKLLPVVQGWPYPTPTAESILVRRDGSDLLYLSELRHRDKGAPLAMRLPLSTPDLLGAMVVSHESVIQNAVDYRGVRVIGVGVPIRGTGWHLVSKVDVSEAGQDVAELRNVITGLSGLLLVLSGAFFVFALRYHRREAQVRESALERQFRVSVDTSIDGFARLDADHRVVEVNAAMEALTGYTSSELIGMGVDIVEAVQSREQIRRDLDDIRARGKARFQTRWRRKDGGLIDVDLSAVFVPNASGGAYFAYARDITAERRARLRLERHGRLNEFLNEITLPLLTIRDPKALLDAVCAAAVRHERFPLVRAGYLAADGRTLEAVVHAGALSGKLGGIVASLDPEHAQGQLPAASAWRERRSVLVSDYQHDFRTAARHAVARELGIRASFSMPVLLHGEPVAVMTFYSGDRDYFDADMVALLEEAGRNLALAWEAGRLAAERDAEHSVRTAMESRFERIVSAVPLPVQIHDARSRQLLAINRAHEQTFGYSQDEIGRDDGWFQRAYPDPERREQLRSLWIAAIETSRRDGVVTTSPEMRVRCRDGTDRVMVSNMTVSGDDAIVIWTDLTGVFAREAALRSSERRFRLLVERSSSAFYAVREGRILYANERMAEIMGGSVEQLLGSDPADVVAPEARPIVDDMQRRIVAGERSVSAQLPVRRLDGAAIMLDVHGVRGSWDDATAFIYTATDVTERASAERRIGEYVGRLEHSLRATLEAVSRMVDLRDPYTAGHERRVGLIAAAIAREMGWDGERCERLELMGLVHDIGKISVPAELLSKPARLTPIEYEMVKAHAQAGYDILKDVPFEFPVAEIVRQHHERLDGSGYPQGLKGDEILPEARILAVADVLESMASHRPYRPAVGLDAAVAELERNRGTFYDAAVVDAMIRLVRERGYRLPK